jgi:two-component system, OmpR family, response regulator
MTKIFIVDDEPSYRDSLDLILSYEDYEVRTAADGIAALEIAGSFVPDVLVVDWVLRGNMNGLELAKTLLESNPDMRIIVITGYATPWLVDQVEDIKGAKVLAKPFGVDEILAALKSVVN